MTNDKNDQSKYREKIETMLEALLIVEKREDDNKLVISPKKMGYPQWQIANDLAICLRVIPTDSGENEFMGAACVFTGLQNNVTILQEIFPGGPNELLEIIRMLFPRIRGKGFGAILKETTEYITAIT